jgi:hypothetical protein
MALFFLTGCGGGGVPTGTPPPATTYTIGGTVSGLSGTGLVLQDNGGNNLTMSANGAFVFTTPLASGSAYAVTVLAQPSSPAQSCAVANGSGTATADVTNVQVACTTTYTIGGTVTGLSSTVIVGSVPLILQDNGGNNLAMSANGAFVFTSPIASGGTYAVTVYTQPSDPALLCAVTNGRGTATADVTNVQVTCTVNPAPCPDVLYPLWTVPGSVAIGQESSETVIIGLDGDISIATAGDASTNWIRKGRRAVIGTHRYAQADGCNGFIPPVTVQVSGLPEGVTASPTSVVFTSTGPPQLMTFSASASAVPSTSTITLTGTSASFTWTLAVPLSIHPAPPATAMCPTSTLPPPPAPHPAPNEWTWEGGSDVNNEPAVYGTQGTPAAGNTPGARVWASTWTDAAGNFWLFGGLGPASAGKEGYLNDLWKYSQGQWTWVSGSDGFNQAGAYGTLGTAAPDNTPGARVEGSTWTDAAGNFWLFGGVGADSTGGPGGDLNDLWKYSGGEWTWMSGSNIANQNGTYGTMGTPAPGNTPGARTSAVSWADACGNLWLFGGEGYDSAGNLGIFNDLWKYSGGEWTWMSGSNIVDQNGTYGTLGTPAPGNVPGSRADAVAWTDQSGNLWLFGGEGNDLNGLLCEETAGPCNLNDLWEYSGGEWTWMGGSNAIDQPGIYGTQGVAAADNVPGARWLAVSWTDPQGNFWLFGGIGVAGTVFGDLNDLWKYSGGRWTWMSGANLPGQTGSYGTLGTAAPTNRPACRDTAAGWVDLSGNLWLFGGDDSFNFGIGGGKFKDLWMYQP